MSAIALPGPNSLTAIRARVNAHQLNWAAPLGMLVIRSVLFVGFQALIALALVQAGSANPWENSAAWWMLTATLTNLVCLGLLVYLFRREGMRYTDLLHLERGRIGRDLLLAIGLLVLALPIAFLPNIVAATLLFGDPAQAAAMFFRPLPALAAAPLLILFPVTVALAELPTYFGYAMPRLEALSGKMWFAVGLAAFFLAFQHVMLPLLMDGRFIVWRLVMYMPFALFVAVVLRWRPRLLPYLMIGHGLLDLLAASMVPWVN